MNFIKAFNRRSIIKTAEETPVFPENVTSLTAGMNVDLVANAKGQVWVMHDRPFPGQLKWMEFDPGAATLDFIRHDGTMLDLGMTVDPVIAGHMRQASQGNVIYQVDEVMKDLYIVPLVVRTTDDMSYQETGEV